MKNEQSNDDDKRDSYPQINRTGTGRSNNPTMMVRCSVDLCVVIVYTISQNISPQNPVQGNNNIIYSMGKDPAKPDWLSAENDEKLSGSLFCSSTSVTS